MSNLAQSIQKATDARLGRAPVLSRKERKAKRDRDEAAVIARVRARVFELDRACICGRCGASSFDEMHEVVPRSKTRGLPPEQRFFVANCVRLSRACHAAVTGELGHGKRLTIECVPAGFSLQWKDGRSLVYSRGQ